MHSDYGACTLRGRQAYAWLARLAPALTGRHTLAELTAQLPGDRRAMVEGLVGRLAEQRFVVDARQARPHGLTGAELSVYAEEIAFIGYALDSPQERFERIRRARLVLTGEGPLLEALVGACVGTGWRHVTIIGPDPGPAARAANAARRDPAQEFRTLTTATDPAAPGWVIAGDPDAPDRVIAGDADKPDRVIAGDVDAPGWVIPGDADVVLQVSADLDSLVATARACEAAGVVLGQVYAGPSEVWMSQVGRPSVTAAESGWHRLAGLSGAVPVAPDEDLLAGPVPTVVAAMPALACFSHVTGLDTGSERTLTRVDLRTLDTLPHRFLPHPRAATRPGGGPEAIEELTKALAPHAPAPGTAPALGIAPAPGIAPSADVEPSELLGRLTEELVDSRLGLLGMLDEQALAQSPLAVCQAVVSDPFGALPGWAPRPRAFGWGPDQRTARLRCLLAALATYGLLALAPDRKGTIWGVNLPDGLPHPVPETSLRLTGRGTSTGTGIGTGTGTGTGVSNGSGSGSGTGIGTSTGTGTPRPPIGTGAGLSWLEALAAGLRSHCEHLLATHLSATPDHQADPAGPAGTSAPAATSTAGTPTAGTFTTATLATDRAESTARLETREDPLAEALLRQLMLAGETPQIRDHTDVLGVPAVALTIPGRETLVSVAATVPDAVRDALERVLLRWQSRTTDQHAYAEARPFWSPDGDPAEAVRTMAGALRRAGKVPVAVPLDGDPEAFRLLPFVTRVVLLDD
ncbi:hypothetical protein AB0I81_52320 [Nonomuraea sp. NPDC050404]|uniref:hypothetical protein n=1 Tax=Nonomuraea sp. NPDC050404 TaxID=3155783 RepID=UPI0033C10496